MFWNLQYFRFLKGVQYAGLFFLGWGDLSFGIFIYFCSRICLEEIDIIIIYIFSLSDCFSFWLGHSGQSCEGGFALCVAIG